MQVAISLAILTLCCGCASPDMILFGEALRKVSEVL